MSVVGILHKELVFSRRVRVLSEQFASLIPRGASVLDVGCGDGLISALLQSLRPDVRVCGVDVLVRKHAHIPISCLTVVIFLLRTRPLMWCCSPTFCTTPSIPVSFRRKPGGWPGNTFLSKTIPGKDSRLACVYPLWTGWATPGSESRCPITIGPSSNGPRSGRTSDYNRRRSSLGFACILSRPTGSLEHGYTSLRC